MSSPVMPGPVAPPPSLPPLLPRRRRSFAGPLVLIVLGVVFLLGNLHMLSWARIGVWFAHYWPVLLILWGVVKLVEYQIAQREGAPRPGIGAGGVFLVVIIVVSGLIATQAERFNWSGLRDQINIDDEDFNNLFGESYTFNQHVEQDVTSGVNSVRINDDHGAVHISVADNEKITIMARKRIGADSQSDAEKYDEQTKPTITTTGGLVTIDAKTQGAGDHPVQSDLDIALPRKIEVHVISHHGDVTVIGRDGDVEITSQRGAVSVEDVKGNVKLNADKSSARIEQITGDVRVEGRLNEISVSDVKGSAQLNGEFMESVKLARISKTVGFKSSRTDMEFSKIDGSLDLDSDDLRADQIGGPLRLTTRSKEIRLDGVSGDVRVEDSNGGVEIDMRTMGNVQIDNRKGDIKLSVPEKSGFRVDARTRDGEIQSDFSELKVENADENGKASGAVGNAAAHIVLNNEHGGIEIRRGSSGGPGEGVRGGVPGGVPGPPGKPPKPGKSLPAPKEHVEPAEN